MSDKSNKRRVIASAFLKSGELFHHTSVNVSAKTPDIEAMRAARNRLHWDLNGALDTFNITFTFPHD